MKQVTYMSIIVLVIGQDVVGSSSLNQFTDRYNPEYGGCIWVEMYIYNTKRSMEHFEDWTNLLASYKRHHKDVIRVCTPCHSPLLSALGI